MRLYLQASQLRSSSVGNKFGIGITALPSSAFAFGDLRSRKTSACDHAFLDVEKLCDFITEHGILDAGRLIALKMALHNGGSFETEIDKENAGLMGITVSIVSAP